MLQINRPTLALEMARDEPEKGRNIMIVTHRQFITIMLCINCTKNGIITLARIIVERKIRHCTQMFKNARIHFLRLFKEILIEPLI